MKNDLICFSHLRWNFVYQRPQHLMSRVARQGRVFYVEEPVYTEKPDQLRVDIDPANRVLVVVPELKAAAGSRGIAEEGFQSRMARLMDQLILDHQITNFVAWYYAPMALAFSGHLRPRAIVYDCMDELSAFKFAPAELVDYERKLLSKADVVFTGGHRLYQAKKTFHQNIYPFPSAIDKTFFYPARTTLPEPTDQVKIPHPRLGFFGVIDERFDIDLVRAMADLKPEWQFIFIGPVIKIDKSSLPANENIHYLGMKGYQELPGYISGWDLCIMPFAINASTEFISPTKTPEFLAAGKRVVSTPIHDVVYPYGADGLVGIAETAEEFVDIVEHDLQEKTDPLWLGKVDQYLSTISWDKTWKNMEEHIVKILKDNYLYASDEVKNRLPDSGTEDVLVDKEREPIPTAENRQVIDRGRSKGIGRRA
jgi:UDP-galactopyranose mutase